MVIRVMISISKWINRRNEDAKVSLQAFHDLFTYLKPYRTLGLYLLGCFLLAQLFFAAYLHWGKGVGWADWTGFAQYTGTIPKDDRGKTLWDWLELLIIPAVLGAGALFFNRQERQNELKIAEERRKSDLEIADNRNQETVLQNYLDKMSELILEKRLMEVKHIQGDVSEEDTKEPDSVSLDAQRAVWNMAQIRTVTILRQLNNTRRNIVLQFLRDANLAGFIFESASLQGANLSLTDLSMVNLSGADLSLANLSWAFLSRSNLGGAMLIETNLSKALLDRSSSLSNMD